MVVAAVWLWPFSPAAGRPATAGNGAVLAGHAGGRILSVTVVGDLALSDPDGRHRTPLNSLGKVGQMVTASPDHRYLSLFNGQVIIVRDGPALAFEHTKVILSSLTATAWPDSFADHERALVMLADYGDPALSSSIPISVVPLATGRPVSLGVGDQVAADPLALGVFTSVAAPTRPSAAVLQANADSGIVLRDAGRAPVSLATAGVLNQDIGQPSSAPVVLVPYPSPSGTQVAVTVRSAAGGSAAGIVVLSRAGRLVGRVPVSSGALGAVAWSPSGASLAYRSTGGSTGSELRIWTIGRRGAASEFPASGTSYGGCVWSPDGIWVLCASTDGENWAIARAMGGRMAVLPGAGFPVAWLRSAGRR